MKEYSKEELIEIIRVWQEWWNWYGNDWYFGNDFPADEKPPFLQADSPHFGKWL